MESVVANLDETVDNIDRYQIEVRKEPRLAKLMKQVHAWYAIRSNDGTWRFAPSKFIGYAGNNARAYLMEAHHRDGRSTEAVLKNWFVVVPPETRRGAELNDALRSFLKSHGHSGPRKDARICVLKEVSATDADIMAVEVRDRISIDTGICGGRPHIRGTRVRVSDILDLFAHGVSKSEILADYPYLCEEDMRAALAFGAAASKHRVILVS